MSTLSLSLGCLAELPPVMPRVLTSSGRDDPPPPRLGPRARPADPLPSLQLVPLARPAAQGDSLSAPFVQDCEVGGGYAPWMGVCRAWCEEEVWVGQLVELRRMGRVHGSGVEDFS